jgi:hypothetical protein
MYDFFLAHSFKVKTVSSQVFKSSLPFFWDCGEAEHHAEDNVGEQNHSPDGRKEAKRKKE